jgi:tetratricopeptide (TPR) repeat protein
MNGRIRARGRVRLILGAASIALVGVLALGVPTRAAGQGVLDDCLTGEPGNRMSACTRAIEDASIGASNRAIAYVERARMYESAGDWGRAIADYDGAIKLDANNADYYFARGGAYAAKGDNIRAIENYGLAIKVDPDEAEYRATRGAACQAMGDVEGAIVDLTDAIHLDAKIPSTYFYRADAYRAHGLLDRAIADFSEAIRLEPTASGAYFARAEVYRAMLNNERAIADYNQAIRLDDSLAGAYFGRAAVRLATGDLKSALTDLDRAINLDPNNAAMRNVRGFVHGAKGDYEKAIADHSAAIVLEPTDAYRYIVRAWAYFKAGKPALGLKDADKAIVLDPGLASAFVTRGRINEALGHKDAAVADLRKALAIAPGNQVAREALKRLGVGATEASPAPPQPETSKFNELERLARYLEQSPSSTTFVTRRDGVAVRRGPAHTFPVIKTLDQRAAVATVMQVKYKVHNACGIDGASSGEVWYKTMLPGGEEGYISSRDLVGQDDSMYLSAAEDLERVVSGYDDRNHGPLRDFAGIYDGLKECKANLRDEDLRDGLTVSMAFMSMPIKQVIWFEGNVMASVRFSNPGVVSRGRLTFRRNFNLREGGAIKLYRITYNNRKSEMIGFYADKLIIDPKIRGNRITYLYATRCDNETAMVEWARKLYEARIGAN